MQITKQITTLNQSQKLYELGVAKTGHLFSWVYDKLNEQWDISNRCVESLELTGRTAYPAFTVAELGQMLGNGFELFIGGNEAEIRAKLLIDCIERGIYDDMTIELINQRLNA